MGAKSLLPVPWAADIAVWVDNALYEGARERRSGLWESMKCLYLSALSLLWQKQEKGQIPAPVGSKVKCWHKSPVLFLPNDSSRALSLRLGIAQQPCHTSHTSTAEAVSGAACTFSCRCYRVPAPAPSWLLPRGFSCGHFLLL